MYESGAPRSVFDAAVNYLTFKDRTVSELKNKLIDNGYGREETEACIRLLSEYGYLNDAEYSRSYIRANRDKKGIGRIRLELIRKGVDKEIISEASEETVCDEVCTIVNIMQRRYDCINFSDEREVRRIYSFFARRGFMYGDIRKAADIYKQNNQINYGI